jgi:hypothetical protein
MTALVKPEEPFWGDDPDEQMAGVLRLLPAVDLATLDAGASLLTRVDRKYVVHVETVRRLVVALSDEWRVLEIDGRRQFCYASTYFDTTDLLTYRAHLQRRRRRYKVRVRRYVDSDDCMLEVKSKGFRGLTVKRRTPHPVTRQADLDSDDLAFVTTALRDQAEPPPGLLHPVVVTDNRRATLASLRSCARLTIDSDLSCGWEDAGITLRPEYVVLESKVQSSASEVDRILRALGERPVDISKYCVGVASIRPDLPSNPWRRTLRRYFESLAS